MVKMRNAKAMALAREVMKRDRNVLRELVGELSIRQPDHSRTSPPVPNDRMTSEGINWPQRRIRELANGISVGSLITLYICLRLPVTSGASSSYRKATER